jgi:hypothetical protein
MPPSARYSVCRHSGMRAAAARTRVVSMVEGRPKPPHPFTDAGS